MDAGGRRRRRELKSLLDEGVLTPSEFEHQMVKEQGGLVVKEEEPCEEPSKKKRSSPKKKQQQPKQPKEEEEEEKPSGVDVKEAKKKKKQKKQPKEEEGVVVAKKRRVKSLEVMAPPVDWRATWDLILELRADRTAVVDSMGSEKLYDMGADEETRQYQVLISLMLSSQTRDLVTAATMGKLKAHGLSIANILDKTSDDELHELIKAVGFHNNKTQYIREATQQLRDEHGGRVPDTMAALCALRGVGPKMALIVLRVAHGITDGIAVDTHVHRIANQLKWSSSVEPTKTPEKTRAGIESWMPREIWDDVNLVLVGLGQELQTEKPKLLQKAIDSSDPQSAIALLKTLGMDPQKVATKANFELPPAPDS